LFTAVRLNADDHSMCAVFEIAGRDQKGLLASVMELLATNACEAQSAAVRAR